MKKELACEKCSYYTTNKSNFNKHLLTKKHINRVSQIEYKCGYCSYVGKRKGDYDKHMLSRKHLCDNTQFVSSSNISTHTNVREHTQLDNTSKLTELVHSLIEENRQLQNKLVEIAKEPKIINNKTFNIINYLNHDCKDAINMSEFIMKLAVSFEDLEKIESQGYLNGIHDTLITSIHNMEETKRPIHCTDIKRKHFYIKDENVWNKEKSDMKIQEVLRLYNTKQLETLSKWKIKNPDWINKDDTQNKVNKINHEIGSLYGDGDKMKNKIINQLSEVTSIANNNINSLK
jgi:hypothetical protein